LFLTKYKNKTMKKITLLFSAAMLAGFTSCNKTNDQAANSANEFNEYVDSVKNATPVYTEENWTVIDMRYQERALKAEAALATLKEEDKIKAEESKEKFAEIKAAYTVEIQKAKDQRIADQKQKLRNDLFGEGKIGSDMSFDFVTGANAREVYHNFVEAIAANKANYSREDWDEIKVMYEALDTRKNIIEKDLATKDNLAIAKDKTRFAEIHAIHRTTAKVSESADSKE
jgi:hypothetical protein